MQHSGEGHYDPTNTNRVCLSQPCVAETDGGTGPLLPEHRRGELREQRQRDGVGRSRTERQRLRSGSPDAPEEKGSDIAHRCQGGRGEDRKRRGGHCGRGGGGEGL